MARNCYCEWARTMLSVFNFGLGVQLQAKNTPLVDFGLAQVIGNWKCGPLSASASASKAAGMGQ